MIRLAVLALSLVAGCSRKPERDNPVLKARPEGNVLYYKIEGEVSPEMKRAPAGMNFVDDRRWYVGENMDDEPAPSGSDTDIDDG